MVQMLWPAVQRYLANLPPERKEALGRIQARIIKDYPKITVELRGDTDLLQVEAELKTLFQGLSQCIPQVTSLFGCETRVFE
jgi:hypothetical protein